MEPLCNFCSTAEKMMKFLYRENSIIYYIYFSRIKDVKVFLSKNVVAFSKPETFGKFCMIEKILSSFYFQGI